MSSGIKPTMRSPISEVLRQAHKLSRAQSHQKSDKNEQKLETSFSTPSNQEEIFDKRKEALIEHKNNILKDIIKNLEKNILSNFMCQDIIKAMNDIEQIMFPSAAESPTNVFSKINEIYSCLCERISIQFELQNKKNPNEYVTMFVKELLVRIFHLCVHSSGISKNQTQSNFTYFTKSYATLKKLFENQSNEECSNCGNFIYQLTDEVPEILKKISMGRGAENKTLQDITDYILNINLNFEETLEKKINTLEPNAKLILSSYHEKKIDLKVVKHSDNNVFIALMEQDEPLPGFIKIFPPFGQRNYKACVAYVKNHKLLAGKPVSYEYHDERFLYMEKISSEIKGERYVLKIRHPKISFQDKFSDFKNKIFALELEVKPEHKKHIQSIPHLLEKISFCGERLFQLQLVVLEEGKRETIPCPIEKLTLHFNSFSFCSSISLDSHGDVFALNRETHEKYYLTHSFQGLDKLQATNAFIRFVAIKQLYQRGSLSTIDSFLIKLPSKAKTNIDNNFEIIILESCVIQNSLIKYLIDSENPEPSLELKFEFGPAPFNDRLGPRLKESGINSNITYEEVKCIKLPGEENHSIKEAHFYFEKPKENNRIYGGPRKLHLKVRDKSKLYFYNGYTINNFIHDRNLNQIENLSTYIYKNHPSSDAREMLPCQVTEANKTNTRDNEQFFMLLPKEKALSLIDKNPDAVLQQNKGIYRYYHYFTPEDSNGHPHPNREIKIEVWAPVPSSDFCYEQLSTIRIPYTVHESTYRAYAIDKDDPQPQEFTVIYKEDKRVFIGENKFYSGF